MLAHEAASVRSDRVLLGAALAVAGLMSASVANVMQGMEIARRLPMVAVLAWAMLIGAAVDALFAWITAGPPAVEARWSYLAGIAWLGLELGRARVGNEVVSTCRSRWSQDH